MVSIVSPYLLCRSGSLIKLKKHSWVTLKARSLHQNSLKIRTWIGPILKGPRLGKRGQFILTHFTPYYYLFIWTHKRQKASLNIKMYKNALQIYFIPLWCEINELNKPIKKKKKNSLHTSSRLVTNLNQTLQFVGVGKSLLHLRMDDHKKVPTFVISSCCALHRAHYSFIKWVPLQIYFWIFMPM